MNTRERLLVGIVSLIAVGCGGGAQGRSEVRADRREVQHSAVERVGAGAPDRSNSTGPDRTADEGGDQLGEVLAQCRSVWVPYLLEKWPQELGREIPLPAAAEGTETPETDQVLARLETERQRYVLEHACRSAVIRGSMALCGEEVAQGYVWDVVVIEVGQTRLDDTIVASASGAYSSVRLGDGMDYLANRPGVRCSSAEDLWEIAQLHLLLAREVQLPDTEKPVLCDPGSFDHKARDCVPARIQEEDGRLILAARVKRRHTRFHVFGNVARAWGRDSGKWEDVVAPVRQWDDWFFSLAGDGRYVGCRVGVRAESDAGEFVRWRSDLEGDWADLCETDAVLSADD